MPITPNNIALPLFVTLIVWRIYSRFRKSVGRQPLQPKRMAVRIFIFAAVTVGLAVMSALFSARMLMALGGGLVLGAPLALLGLHFTKFEETPEGKFYTPNTYIGLALSLTFFLRFIYRMLILYANTQALTKTQQPAAMQSPLTIFIFALLAGYYMAYYAGVLWRTHR